MRNFGKISINEGNNMTVNQKIRIMRKERNITTTVLSEKIGISQSSVVRYENGSVKYVPLDLLDKMAEVFGCSVDDLIEGDSRYTQKKTELNQSSYLRMSKIFWSNIGNYQPKKRTQS